MRGIGRSRNRASSSSIWRSTIRAATPLVPPTPTSRWQTRLGDRFYDLYVHDPDAEDRRRPAAAARARTTRTAWSRRRRMLRTAYGMIEQEMASAGPGRWAMPSPWPTAPPAPALFYANKLVPFGDSHRHVAALFRAADASALRSRARSPRPSPTSSSFPAEASAVLQSAAPLDLMFQALADPTRRIMVERLSARSGFGERARRAARHDAVGGGAAPRGARGQRPGAVGEGGPGPHLPHRARRAARPSAGSASGAASWERRLDRLGDFLAETEHFGETRRKT